MIKKFIIVICLSLMFSCSQEDRPRDPPEGWKIVSNGKEYLFVFPSGSRSIFAENTYQDAVDAAWAQFKFEYELEDRDRWPVVTREN